MKDQSTQFTDQELQAISDASTRINEWAEEKGWNEPTTSAGAACEQLLCRFAVGMVYFGEAVEAVRKGQPIPIAARPLVAELGDSAKGFANEQSIPDLRFLDPSQRRRLAQHALMMTENVEAILAILTGDADDHVPELTGEEAEMADYFIRGLHYCGEHRIDIARALKLKQAFNIGRPYRHGDKQA